VTNQSVDRSRNVTLRLPLSAAVPLQSRVRGDAIRQSQARSRHVRAGVTSTVASRKSQVASRKLSSERSRNRRRSRRNALPHGILRVCRWACGAVAKMWQNGDPL